MVAANKLLHLLEAFSTSWFLFSAAQNHHLVFFLLEAFNNIIQYQFDGKRRLTCNRTGLCGFEKLCSFFGCCCQDECSRRSFNAHLHLVNLSLFLSPHQGTATWCTPSSANVMCSTSWPTCHLIPLPFRRLCRGRESLQMSFPAPAPRRLYPWRDPTLLCQQSPVP